MAHRPKQNTQATVNKQTPTPPQSSLTLTPHFHFYAPISREAVCCTVTPSELTIGAHMSYPFLNPLPYITGPLSCPLIANKALGRKLGSNGAGGKQGKREGRLERMQGGEKVDGERTNARKSGAAHLERRRTEGIEERNRKKMEA